MLTAVKTGSGSHTYEWVSDWPKLPPNVNLGYTHGVVTSSSGRVFVFNQSMHSVIAFDPDGRYLYSWGEEFASGAHGFCLSQEGGVEYLYLTDYVQPCVVKATLDGQILLRLGVPDLPDVYPSPELYKPTQVCVGPNGDIYVADGYGQSVILQYNSDGHLIRWWGGEGDGPGNMRCPHGIWLDTRSDEPVLLVADRINVRIQVFTLDGNHVRFDTPDIRYPCNFCQMGSEMIVPDLHGRVTILDSANRATVHLGDNPGVENRPGYPNLPSLEREEGKFISPHQASADGRGDIYVVEWVSDGRITKLVKI